MKQMMQRMPAGGFGGYEAARAILENGDRAAQLGLARDESAPPEALYFLASSADADVRGSVAANAATPLKADALLVQDGADGVRAELARKFGRLLPGLTDAARNQLREQSIAILEALAADQAPRVRAMLAEAIKENPRAPKHVIQRLANDPELQVCGPILEYSPLLSDVDLREIIAATQVKGALEAIARRPDVSAEISDGLVRTQNVAAVAALLGNPNAQIREDTLDAILDGAPAVEEWHALLVVRANLSIRAIRRISGFVAAALVDRLIAVQALDDELAEELLLTVRQRIADTPVDAAAAQRAEEEAASVVARGQFNDAWVCEELASGAKAKVIAACGFAASVGVVAAKKMVAARNPRAMLALCWKAGLSARTAYDAQQQLAGIPSSQLIAAKDGRDYPLDDAEMEWILDTFAD